MRRAAVFALVGLLGGIGIALMPATPESKTILAAPTIEKATHKNYTEKLSDDVKFEMVAVPGGTFTMGSPDKEPGRNQDEVPLHEVKIRPFWMGKCEVTWDEFDLWWKAEEKKDAPPKNENDAVTSPTPPYVDETYGHEREK